MLIVTELVDEPQPQHPPLPKSPHGSSTRVEQSLPSRLDRVFYIVDVHHHMGKEENVKNLQPASPDGSYNFFRHVLHGTTYKDGVLKELSENKDEYRYVVVDQSKSLLTYHRHLLPFTDLSGKYGRPDLAKLFEDTAIIDQTVVFPMRDIYREREIPTYKDRTMTTPVYSYSNSRISQIVHSYPNSLRLIGFGRVRPTDEHALEEVERLVIDEGLRGIKLHPKNDGFSIEDEALKSFFLKTAQYGLPVLFHTSFITEVEKIYHAVNAVVKILITKHMEKHTPDRPALAHLFQKLGNLKVIIGHCGWHLSKELFQYLTHPNLYGEVSGIKGENVQRFCTSAARELKVAYFYTEILPQLADDCSLPLDLFQDLYYPVLNTRWSNKIMFGTDYPFLDQNQTIDVMLTLFKKDFIGTAIDIQNFLGLNALRIIPPMYSTPYIRTRYVSEPHISKWSLSSSDSAQFHDNFFGTVLQALKKKTLHTVYTDLVIDPYPFERIRFADVILTLVANGTNRKAISVWLSGLLEPLKIGQVPEIVDEAGEKKETLQMSHESSYINAPFAPKMRLIARGVEPNMLIKLTQRHVPPSGQFIQWLLKAEPSHPPDHEPTQSVLELLNALLPKQQDTSSQATQ